MGLAETLQNAAQLAIGAVGNVARTIWYDSFVTSVYDTSAGISSATYEKYETGVIIQTRESRTAEGIVFTTFKAIAAQKDCSFYPSKRDRLWLVENHSSIEYRVSDISHDPAMATWELVLNRIG